MTARTARMPHGIGPATIARRIATAAVAASAVFAVVSAFAATPRCERHDARRIAFVGDLHVHTALSLDAATQDTRARPADAYAFARGGELGLPPYDDAGNALRRMRLDRPLDFAAVTDHAELLGEVALCAAAQSAVRDAWQCLVYRHVPRVAYYLFNYQASRNQRLGMCGEDGRLCVDAAAGPWKEIQQAAAVAQDSAPACRFTSFVAYEWTGARGEESANMHRNVIFSSANVLPLPITFIETQDAETLWERLENECRAALPGCDVIAIPHNSNLSAGHMFDGKRRDGSAYTRADLELRARTEVVFEIMQHKGASECHPSAYAGVPLDESCAFEALPADAFGGIAFPSRRRPPEPGTGFLREILRDGLRHEARSGIDPFRMGVIGSTDTHIGAAGATLENEFVGHGGAGTPATEDAGKRLPDRIDFNPGGLAFVYAEENTRESLFAGLRRRETYASSGTRPALRFFAAETFPPGLCDGPDLIEHGYAHGVPMGDELSLAAGEAPEFAVSALRDPLQGEALDRVEIIKGWVDADGGSRERVVRVAEAGAEGAAALCATWRDTAYRDGERAWYYARILERPAPRWSTFACAERRVECGAGADPDDELAACCDASRNPLIAERAWSSPIWVGPEQHARAAADEAMPR